jgi:hypothetical protein
MNPTHAYGDVLSRLNLESALLMLSTRDFEKRASRTVTVRKWGSVVIIFDTNA